MKLAAVCNFLRLNALLALLCIPLIVHADIAFIRKTGLYILRCGPSGVPMPNAPAIFVCHLWKLTDVDIESVQWLRSGAILIGHEVNCRANGSRFGVPKGKTVDGYWVVRAKPHAKLHRASRLIRSELIDGNMESKPVLSPDGRYAVVRSANQTNSDDYMRQDLRDLRTGKIIKRLEPGEDLHWSTDGKLLFDYAIDTDPKYAPITWFLTIDHFPSLAVIKRFPPRWHISFGGLSPNGKLLAEHFYNPGDMPPDVITNLETGKGRTIPGPSRFVGPLFYFWTNSGKSAICDWPVPNPEDDGNSKKDFIGKVTFSPLKFLNFGAGTDVQQSVDGTHFFYISETARGDLTGNLYVTSTANKNRRRLVARNVSAYAVSDIGLFYGPGSPL